MSRGEEDVKREQTVFMEEGLFCGKCMNSVGFQLRTIVPRFEGSCVCCGDGGTLWELGGITLPAAMLSASKDDPNV